VRDDVKTRRLAGIPLFAHLHRREVQRVAALCTDIVVEPGRVLCRQGSPGSEMFVIEEGAFSVEQDGRQVAELAAGDFFGELALLGGGPRTATVVATTPGRVLVLGQPELDALLREEPVVAVRMLPGIGQHVRRMGAAVSRQGAVPV